jgi:hypothetical protein
VSAYEASAEEIVELNEQYESIPTFSDWARAVRVDEQSWSTATRLLVRHRSNLGEEFASELVSAAMRAAAVNTGAIEGLHPADRGLTMTVRTHRGFDRATHAAATV